jgi:hypothetical protein
MQGSALAAHRAGDAECDASLAGRAREPRGDAHVPIDVCLKGEPRRGQT